MSVNASSILSNLQSVAPVGCGTTLTPLCEFVESIVNNQEARNLNRKGCMPVPTLLSSAFQSKQKSRNSFNRGKDIITFFCQQMLECPQGDSTFVHGAPKLGCHAAFKHLDLSH